MENGKYQYELVERMSFVRYGGTDAELKAANILLGEIEKLGGRGELMDFKIPAYDWTVCRAVADGKEIEVTPYGMAGSLGAEGKELRLIYVEDGEESNFYGLGDLSDTAVLVNAMKVDVYKRLVEHKAAAFILINGKWFNTDATTDLIPRPMRPEFLKYGKVPGFCMRAADATELVRSEVEKITLFYEENVYENTSRDVLAVIEGSEIAGEDIVLTAHFDSVLVGTGSWDNATGSATLMYLYNYFLENKPRRTMRFIWCGSEEQGLYGSKAYIAQHEDLMDSIKFCFNFDMCGTVLGPDSINVTGGDDLLHLTEQYCREVGRPALIRKRVHSSDSAPFCDRGVPALGISRRSDTAEIHTRNDLMFPLSAKSLASTGDFAAKFISRIVNSAILPVNTGMPDDMKKELDKYFKREK